MKEKKTPMETFNELGVKKTTIAKELGISYRALQNRLKGTVPFNTDEIKKLCEKFHLSRDLFF